MFISPYDTTVGQSLKGIDRVRTALEVAYVGKTLSTQGVDSEPVLELLGNKRGLEDIPKFGHPVTLKTVLDGHKIVIDQRPYARIPVNLEYAGSKTDIQNAREYNLLSGRAWLQVGWEIGIRAGKDASIRTNAFERISPLPLRIFAEWLTGQITQRLGIDEQQARDITIITAWYYLSQFRTEVSDADRLALVRYIQSSFRYDFETIQLVTANLKHLPDLRSYIEALRDSGISPRLLTLTPALVFQITSYSWIGGSAKEVAGIALEHPPTFIMLCIAADADAGYSDTVLGRIMKAQRKMNRDVIDFRSNVKHLLEKCRGITNF